MTVLCLPIGTRFEMHHLKPYTMSDDKNKRGQQDRDRVNVNEAYELRYWEERFGVSAEELKKAVAEVGPMAKDVEQQLRGMKKKPDRNA